jgi:hypothetical protein
MDESTKHAAGVSGGGSRAISALAYSSGPKLAGSRMTNTVAQAPKEQENAKLA